jgi:hypothetical protein
MFFRRTFNSFDRTLQQTQENSIFCPSLNGANYNHTNYVSDKLFLSIITHNTINPEDDNARRDKYLFSQLLFNNFELELS